LLFFPAAGNSNGTDLGSAGSRGLYWSSTLYSGNTGHAYGLDFNSSDANPEYCYDRYLMDYKYQVS